MSLYQWETNGKRGYVHAHGAADAISLVYLRMTSLGFHLTFEDVDLEYVGSTDADDPFILITNN